MKNSASIFHDQVLFLVYVFCWNNKYVLENISLSSPESLKNSYTNFSIKTFPIDTDIINFFHYIWGIRFIDENT